MATWISKGRRPKSVKATRKVDGRTYRFAGATLAVDGKRHAESQAEKLREKGKNVRVVRVKPKKEKGKAQGAGGYALYEASSRRKKASTKKSTRKRTTRKKR